MLQINQKQNKFSVVPCKVWRGLAMPLVSCLLLLVASSVSATTLYLMPQSQTIYQGDSFIVEIRLDTEEEINTVKANLIFPSDLLEVVDINKGGSILALWPEEPDVFNNEIYFLGGVPGGFKGDGIIARVIFTGKEISGAEVSFKEACHVLLNDGQGTSADLSLLGASYDIIEKIQALPLIFSTTHPDQNKWSKSSIFHIHWDLVEEAEYSYLLSQDSLAEPDNIPDKPEGELVWMGDMKYVDLEDGIYYFTLKQKDPDQNWSEKISYRAMIDSVAPEEFSLKIAQDQSLFEGKYFLNFFTTDNGSGIDYYKIKEGKRDWKTISSPYLLEDQGLQSIIKVAAVDKAGNERIAEYLPSETKKLFPWQIIILILAVIGVICLIIKRISAKPRKSLT